MSKASASRSFGLSNGDIKALAEQYTKDKTFPNPYRGFYGTTIAALAGLGLNKLHPLAKVKEQMVRIIGATRFAEFERKDARTLARPRKAGMAFVKPDQS